MLQNPSQRSKITRLLRQSRHPPRSSPLGLWGCQTSSPSDITGSLGEKAEEAVRPIRGAISRPLASASSANPKDVDAAMKYGKALRATGQKSQAVAVLEQASIANPNNPPLLAGYGRALADNGNFQQAFDVLGRAHTPEDPDWRILSAQGATLDQLGRFEEARQYYTSALKIAPDEPSRAVQSRALLRAVERSAQGGGNAAARP